MGFGLLTVTVVGGGINPRIWEQGLFLPGNEENSAD